jgi:signal transduction histidine kinase/DNA-binding response OmpR family regulator
VGGTGQLAAVAPAPERRATILLVDDHPPNLMALEAILEPLGSILVSVSSGAQALDVAASTDLALVLLDLQMPELDGLETAVLLKKHARTKALPIIIVTADEPTRSQVAQGYESGAVDFLSKPLDPDVLRSKVAVFVELWMRQRESVTPRSNDEGSGRLSERLVAAAPPSEQAATVEALLRIHGALTEDLDVTNLAQRLAQQARELTRASGAAFHYRERSGHWTSVFVGRMRPMLAELGPDAAILAPVFDRGAIVRHDHGRRLPRLVGSLLSAPVVARDGSVEGALVLVHESAYVFDLRDEELVAIAASHAASAFDNARLYDEAKEARHRAEVAELELRAGEARLRIALEAAGLGTWDYNPITDQLRWDARCRALAGLAPESDVDWNVFMRSIHPDDRERVRAAVRRALDPNTDMGFDVEYRAIGIDDQVERWLVARGVGIAENGQAVRFIGAMLDITGKKRIEVERAEILEREKHARAAAETASRSKDEFLATVSHELRNPLNAILGWARVLVEEKDLDADRRKKGLDVILRNAKTQVQLVEDILEVSRIITGKMQLSTGPVDVATVAEAAIDAVRAAAAAKRVVLATNIERPLGTIIADEDRIQQILWNLLLNAVKFTPADGTVSLQARRLEAGLELVITDTGEGIDEAFLPYVFDRFRQFDGSTTRAHGGLGLGLAIVRHLAELHGGTVRAESEGRGRGARFTVTLPAAAMTDSPKNTGPVPPPSRRGEAKKPLSDRKVVVVDDDPDMRELLAMILEDAGALVRCCTTVAAALQAIEADMPDVAISDLAMPGEDGYAFVRRVRTEVSEPARSIPLVAMTAYARAEDRRRVLDAGFDRHVAKPIEPEELVEALALVIDRRPSPISG